MWIKGGINKVNRSSKFSSKPQYFPRRYKLPDLGGLFSKKNFKPVAMGLLFGGNCWSIDHQQLQQLVVAKPELPWPAWYKIFFRGYFANSEANIASNNPLDNKRKRVDLLLHHNAQPFLKSQCRDRFKQQIVNEAQVFLLIFFAILFLMKDIVNDEL